MTEDRKRFANGSGTADDAYWISSQDDLMELVSGLSSDNDYEGVYFIVKEDIKLDRFWPGIGTAEIKTALTNSPYVESGIGFAGILDGGGHTITVQRTELDKQGVGGLINYLAPAGEIHNLKVAGWVTLLYSLRASMESPVDGLSAVGGVVGYNCGIIDGVDSSVTVSIKDEYDTTGVPPEVFDVGGIAGFNDNYYMTGARGVIRNCSNSGNVTGYEKVGGIAGENAGLITSCSNSGRITPVSTTRSGSGGIAGRNGNNNTPVETGHIWNCYNTGDIYSGEEDRPYTQSSWVGGIAGFQNIRSEIRNCYNTGNLRAASWAGYIAGSCRYENQVPAREENDGGQAYRDEDYGVFNSYIPAIYDTNGKLIPALHGGIMSTGAHDNEITIFGSLAKEADMQKKSFASILQADTAASYGIWLGEDGSYPILENNATQSNAPAKSWKLEEREIYLKPVEAGSAETEGDGTSPDSPVHTLQKAIELASSTQGNKVGLSNIHIMDTVPIKEGMTLYDSVTYTRYETCTGPMFTIDAPNNKYGIAYVTFEGAVIDGCGTGTIFQVKQGRLRLRDNCMLENAEIGVSINASAGVQAQAEFNETWIKTGVSAQVESATTGTGGGNGDTNNLIINPFAIYKVRLEGVVKLAEGAYISVGSSLSCNVTIECESWTKDRMVAVGYIDEDPESIYTLKAADAKHVYIADESSYCAALEADADTGNKLVLTPVIFLNGNLGDKGSGTEDDPYSNWSDALDAAKPGGWIKVKGTTEIPAGSYTKNVVVRRASEFDSEEPMFKIAASGGTASLSNMTINGGGSVIAKVSAGMLELSGGNGADGNGVILTNSSIAVDVASGAAVTVLDAEISASGYSIRLADSSSEFTLTPAAGTGINGTVYLPEGTYIRVGAALTNLSCALTVVCANPYIGSTIARVTGSYGAFTEADLVYVSYLNGTYGVGISQKVKTSLQLTAPAPSSAMDNEDGSNE